MLQMKSSFYTDFVFGAKVIPSLTSGGGGFTSVNGVPVSE